MVYHTLASFAEGLSEHLSRVFALRDEMVQLAAPDVKNATPPNKLLVMLAGVERETAGGISFANYPAGERFAKSAPPWQVNIYMLVAAFFAEKQYGEGLRALSEALRYIQNNPLLTVPTVKETLTVEAVNLSFSELSNLWGIFGGSYRPSILCKVRVLQLSGGEMRRTATPITQKETGQ